MDSYTYRNCRLCPRQCGVNRLEGAVGFCGETADLKIAVIEAHFGEEPPISGTNGSGTVFFTGCTLRCDFCQNFQLSHQHLGQIVSVADAVERIGNLYAAQGIHNVNLVTPDHFFPHIQAMVTALRARQINIPIVFNTSGYERVELLRELEEYADIYLPDFKYADRKLGAALSHCPDYPAIALDALAEMVRQKGFLDSCNSEDMNDIAQRGVLVRHLILPGQAQNSLNALSMLFLEFGKHLPVSLMSQYHPVRPCAVPDLDRRITAAEFQEVYDHALTLGFQHLFVQFPEMPSEQSPEFLPDFTENRPFKGNIIYHDTDTESNT